MLIYQWHKCGSVKFSLDFDVNSAAPFENTSAVTTHSAAVSNSLSLTHASNLEFSICLYVPVSKSSRQSQIHQIQVW